MREVDDPGDKQDGDRERGDGHDPAAGGRRRPAHRGAGSSPAAAAGRRGTGGQHGRRRRRAGGERRRGRQVGERDEISPVVGDSEQPAAFGIFDVEASGMPELGGQIGAGRVDHLGAGTVQLVAGDRLGPAAGQREGGTVVAPLAANEHGAHGGAVGERARDGHGDGRCPSSCGLVTLLCASRSIATMRRKRAAGLARWTRAGMVELPERGAHAAHDGRVARSDAGAHERKLGGQPGCVGARGGRGGACGNRGALRAGLGDARGLRLTLSDGQLFGADWTAVAGRCGGAEQEPESKETDEEDGSGERSPPVVSEPHQTSRLQTSRAISLMGSLVERCLTRLRS